MENHIAMHGWKRFPGDLVTTQNTRKERHEHGKKTSLLFLEQQKLLKKNVKRQRSSPKKVFEFRTTDCDEGLTSLTH